MKTINQKTYDYKDSAERISRQQELGQSFFAESASALFGWKTIITLFLKSAITKLKRFDEKFPEVAVRIATVLGIDKFQATSAPRPGLQCVPNRPRLLFSNDYLYILN